MQTVDEKAFMDGLRCMYYLDKREIAHTTNFASLKELCMLLGNDSLPLLQKGANVNYNFGYLKQLYCIPMLYTCMCITVW